MAEGVWEQLVETYLAIDRGCFLNPQYIVEGPEKWRAEPDFLAVNFPDNEVWMVEVTKAPYGLKGKISEFEKDYIPKIREQLIRHRVIRDIDADPKWTFGFWIFTIEKEKSWVEGALSAACIATSRVTALEEIAFPKWEMRYR